MRHQACKLRLAICLSIVLAGGGDEAALPCQATQIEDPSLQASPVWLHCNEDGHSAIFSDLRQIVAMHAPKMRGHLARSLVRVSLDKELDKPTP